MSKNERLKESEKRYRLLADNINDVIWTMDMNLHFTYISPSVKFHRGYSAEEAVALTVEQTLPPASIEKAMQALDQGMKELQTASREEREGASVTMEIENYCKDGSTIPVESTISFLFGKDDMPTGFIGVSRNITERKQMEAELRKLSQAVKQSANMVVITDLQGTIEYVNPKFTELTGYTSEEVIGQNTRLLKSNKQDNTFYHEMWTTITAGKEWHGELQNRCKDGSLNWELMSIAPVYDSEGKMTNYIAIKENITRRKQAEEKLHKYAAELEKAKAIAETANKAKNIFLSNMSHELRTPLNGIIGYTQLLKQEPELADSILKELNIIENNGTHLLTLISDILDIAKIEAGKMGIYPAPVNLPELLSGVVSILQIGARQKNIQLTYHASKGLPSLVLADEKRIRQILLNLLGNAVKFTHKGSVILSVQASVPKPEQNNPSQEKRVSLCFRIVDTGVGMTEEQLRRAFKPFEQVGHTGCKHEGTGLGLTISHRLIKLMDGKIQAKSVPGQGSNFQFRITLPVTDQPF